MVRYNRNAAAFIWVIIMSLVLGSSVGGQKKEEITKPAVERLVSEKLSEITEARDELVASRKKLIGELIGIIRTKENREERQNSVRAVMYVLGEMRAVEAIDVLLEYISYPRYFDGKGSLITEWSTGLHGSIFEDIGRTYPAVGALVKIGEPCLNPVTKKLCHFTSFDDMKSCLTVLVALKGVEVVNKDLKMRLEKETDAEVKQRIEDTLRYLAKEQRQHEADMSGR